MCTGRVITVHKITGLTRPTDTGLAGDAVDLRPKREGARGGSSRGLSLGR
jgi:hypothetical protein